jgi:serine/threonine protein phosphatase PrpC
VTGDPTSLTPPPPAPPQPEREPGVGPGPGGPAPVSQGNVDRADLPTPPQTVTPTPPVAGEESPLDIGWTGVVPGARSAYEQAPSAPTCPACGQGHFLDGYCDHCGAKEPDPRDHIEESPATWVGGVSDIGRRHTRNEDAVALAAEPALGTRAVLVVCDGVSNTTDSHIASLAGARAARTVLDQPLATGVGTPEAIRAAAVRRLNEAVQAANAAVIATVTDRADPTPPSCTFTGAVVTGGTAVVGNVGDSRIYWLPDSGDGARQLSRDDSYAADRIASGVERKEAETGPMAHSITRWLGIDAPDDLTPHTTEVALDRAGWLMLCSDGLWNYCSEASDLQALLARLTGEGRAGTPTELARALVDFANNAGGADNITVALARVEQAAPTEGDGAHG